MVCKNCGADLKPNTKYCLECGSYIDDDDDDEGKTSDLGELSTDYKPVRLREEEEDFVPKKKKRKKLNLTMSDYLIYGGLLTVMIVSIIVIIVSLVTGKNQEEEIQNTASPTVQQDKNYSIDDYEITVPGKYISTIEDSVLYVSDDVNYTFSFQSSQEDFDAYLANPESLKENLKGQYNVVSSTEKTASGRDFIVSEIKVGTENKILYLTKINSKHTAMGIIEVLPNGDWEMALSVIGELVNSINFQSTGDSSELVK